MFLRGFSFRVTHDDKVNVSEKWVMALVWCHGFSFLTAGLDNSKVKENSVNSLHLTGRTLGRRAAGNRGIGCHLLIHLNITNHRDEPKHN